MNKKSDLFFLLLCLLFFSCNKNQKQVTSSYEYNLIEKKDKLIKFDIDPDIEYNLTTLFYYKDNEKSEYITFQNGRKNEIIFYCFKNPDLSFRLPLAIEGPNGVGPFNGYYIEDFKHIYITTPGLSNICRIDTSGMLLQKISYEKTEDGLSLIPSFKSYTFVYSPLVIINNQFYFTQATREYLGLSLQESPVSAFVDTLNSTVEVLPFCYSDVIKNENVNKNTLGIEFSFSRCYDYNNFIYSFYLDENIYIASQDHKEIKKVLAKSKYIKQIKTNIKRPDDTILGIKLENEIAQYGNLIYDQYREVYYRIAHPETEIGPDENYIEVIRSGRKKFSVIILDKDFNVIGETLFPDYTYISNCMFVNKDGLYIRSNHYKSSDFNEDIFSFTCFELVKE